MNSIKKHFSLLFLIVPPKLGLKAEKVFRLLNTPEQYFVFAKGTANSTIVDMLGLGEPDKTVTIVPLQTDLAHKAVATLQNELYLGAPNTGIAFTVPINGGSLGILQLLSQNATAEEKQEESSMNTDHSLILAFVNQGYSEEVMSAARKAGAGGGTVFHTRRVESDDAAAFWGISIQEEREIVLILAKKEQKKAIMEAISQNCGTKTDAHGVVISLPVDEIAGLKKEIN